MGVATGSSVDYPDRIEVENPGGLRIALDVMLAGGVSDARNPTLMKTLGLINACEKEGSGLRRYEARSSGCAGSAAHCGGKLRSRLGVESLVASMAPELSWPTRC